MKLPQIAIEQYQFTLVMLLLLTLLGLASFFTMPRSEDPQFNFPAATVVAVLPGANPADVEQLVVDPLEASINELEDLNKIETSVKDGVAVIFVQFLNGTDPDEAYNDVVDAVADTRDDLPVEMSTLDVRKQSPTDVNIIQVALVSEQSTYRQLKRQAERLETRLNRVSGVKRADTWGYPVQEIRVSLNLERMREIGLSLSQVTQAIQAGSANIPGGDLDIGERRFNIRTSGDFESLTDIRRTVIHAAGERMVYLEDLATVEYANADETHRMRLSEQRAVFVTAIQREGSNIFTVREGLIEQIEAFQIELPQAITAEVFFDQSDSVAFRVNGFFINLLQGVLLVGIVVLLALGFRASFIVMLAIPISIFMALGLLDFSGFGLQQMSIVGLVIALGLLVDNAIVVTENVERHLKMGASGRDAALLGTSQVGWAIVSSTVTTLLAFLPMVLLQTGTGDFIRSMPITVIYALVASLLVSLTLTPFVASRLLKSRAVTKSNSEHSSRWFQRKVERFVAGPYRRILQAATHHPKLVLGAALAIFIGSMMLFPMVGVSLFPKAEKPQFLINIDLPEGASLNKTDAVTRDIEALLADHPQIESFATNIGNGNPRIYYNEFPKNDNPTHAQLVVTIKNNDHTMTGTVVQDLRAQFDRYPGVRIEIKEFAQGPPLKAPIAIRVVGDNLDILRSLARDVETVIAETPGTLDLDNPSNRRKTDLQVNINRDKAGLLGIPLIEIDRTVRAAMAGLPVSSFRDERGDDYDITVRLPLQDRPAVGDFDRISVASIKGARIPLRQVANVAFTSSPTQIEHYDLERVATITADVGSAYNVATITQEITQQLDALTWPRGYRYEVGGEQASREESFGGMGQALILALLGIFGVLVLQFRSFSQPIIVFAAIPFAITGAVLALLLTGYTFSFTAFIGLTSLVGIVVNNSIILVDYANQLRREGLSLADAVQQAGETRFMPIILTTLTTIGGLLPLTLQGSTMWSPMGWSIIGGLLLSTVLTLIVVPVLYKTLTPETIEALAV